MNIKEMQAKLESAKKEAKKKVEEKKAELALKAELNRLNNEDLLEKEAQAALIRDTTDKLKLLEASLAQIVADTPVYDTRAKQNKVWKPVRDFNYGNHISLITAILNGINYASAVHKEEMLALTGLDEDLVESTLESFGSQSYYNRNLEVVVDERQFNVEELLKNLALIEQILQVNLNKSKLTEEYMSQVFERARIKAEKDRSEANLTRSIEESLIALD